MGEEYIDFETNEEDEIICPECGEGTLEKGPRGGAAINGRCVNCQQEYWYGPGFGLKKL